MATPLMSLSSPGTIKHVVPWKTRQDFLYVYEDLYSDIESRQRQAINRIDTWRSRVGNHLSVAIDSSASLRQAHLDYRVAKNEDCLQKKDAQLKATSSLALIRFVNHITEKSQTKATAQPVHLIAREFGIPEWIVRIRHDATHGTMPCLDSLVTGVEWALNYLKDQFWQKQLEQKEEVMEEKEKVNKLRMTDVRKTMYGFQKARFQELNVTSDDDEKTEKPKEDHRNVLQAIQSYISKNRSAFIKCFLEDGILISTEEQLAVFEVWPNDLLAHSPPTMPLEITEFWQPVLIKMYNSGALPLLMHFAMFSVTSEQNLRNYQLVAWLHYLLAQSTDTRGRSNRKRKRKQDELVKCPLLIPKKTLLAACLQNINSYTVHLLKYLVDIESLGPDMYNKIITLLKKIDTQGSHKMETEGKRQKQDKTESQDLMSEDTESEPDDTVYTVEDLKKEKERANDVQEDAHTVENVQNSIGKHDVPWAVCTDLIDWSTVPFGVIPDPSQDEMDEDEELEDENKLLGSASESDNNKNDDDLRSDSDDDNGKPYRGDRRKRSSFENKSDSVSPKNSSFVMEDDIL